MGMKLYVFTVMAFIGTAVVINHDIAASVSKPSAELAAERMGEIFMQYRAAVATFEQQNPGFTGSVPAASLAAMGFHFPQDFLNSAGNGITAFGTNGRVITSYGSLAAGSGFVAARGSQGDASLGVASGANWISYSGGVSTPLAIAVPNNSVVSVTQIGK